MVETHSKMSEDKIGMALSFHDKRMRHNEKHFVIKICNQYSNLNWESGTKRGRFL